MKSKVGLIVGGSGALGKSVVSVFKAHGWRLLNLDVRANEQADANITLRADSIQSQLALIHEQTKAFSQAFDSVICTAGGFEAGSVRDRDIFEKYDKLDRMCAQSALLSGHLGAHYLGEQGFLCLTGAAKVFEGPVNWAFAYGLTKQATHALALHLAEREDLPKSASVCTILPNTIDTPANREAMTPDGTWLPPQKVAEVLRMWAEGENRPENGSFAKLTYKNECVVPEFL